MSGWTLYSLANTKGTIPWGRAAWNKIEWQFKILDPFSQLCAVCQFVTQDCSIPEQWLCAEQSLFSAWHELSLLRIRATSKRRAARITSPFFEEFSFFFLKVNRLFLVTHVSVNLVRQRQNLPKKKDRPVYYRLQRESDNVPGGCQSKYRSNRAVPKFPRPDAKSIMRSIFRKIK